MWWDGENWILILDSTQFKASTDTKPLSSLIIESKYIVHVHYTMFSCTYCRSPTMVHPLTLFKDLSWCILLRCVPQPDSFILFMGIIFTVENRVLTISFACHSWPHCHQLSSGFTWWKWAQDWLERLRNSNHLTHNQLKHPLLVWALFILLFLIWTCQNEHFLGCMGFLCRIQ